MKPPQRRAQPDPEVTIQRPERPAMPAMPPAPPLKARPRVRTLPSAVSQAGPAPQPPRSWRFPDGYAGEEAKTPSGSMDRRMLESVIAAFHQLSTQHRLDLAELGGIFAALEANGARERFLALGRTFGNAATEPARCELLEILLLASEMAPADRARLIRVARALRDPDEIDVAVE